MMSIKTGERPLVARDPEIMGATTVFADTRVPVVTLVDYLEGGYSLDEFFADFPGVSRKQAHAALELLRQTLLSR